MERQPLVLSERPRLQVLVRVVKHVGVCRQGPAGQRQCWRCAWRLPPPPPVSQRAQAGRRHLRRAAHALGMPRAALEPPTSVKLPHIEPAAPGHPTPMLWETVASCSTGGGSKTRRRPARHGMAWHGGFSGSNRPQHPPQAGAASKAGAQATMPPLSGPLPHPIHTIRAITMNLRAQRSIDRVTGVGHHWSVDQTQVTCGSARVVKVSNSLGTMRAPPQAAPASFVRAGSSGRGSSQVPATEVRSRQQRTLVYDFRR